MKILKQSVIALIVLLCCSSCFDIVEEASITKSGAGQIKATLNLSKSKTKVASLLLLDQVNGVKIPSKAEVQTQMNTLSKLLQQTPGISNVKQQLDWTNYIASISCDFSDIKALNTFQKTLSEHFKVKVAGYSTYDYDVKAKKLTRTYQHDIALKNAYNKLKGDNKEAFREAYYTSIFRFEQPVKSQSNKVAKLSPNKTAVMLKTEILNLINGQVSLGNTIQLN